MDKMPHIHIVIIDCDTEALALRQVLEQFGAVVTVSYIGRPNNFIDVLEGNIPFKPDYYVFCGHGDNGIFLMPKLAEFVYETGEPHDISCTEIRKHLKIENRVIISTACTTGSKETAEAFTEKNNIYIAPDDYIEASAGLFFVIRFFYEHIILKTDIEKSSTNASETDSECGMYTLFSK